MKLQWRSENRPTVRTPNAVTAGESEPANADAGADQALADEQPEEEEPVEDQEMEVD